MSVVTGQGRPPFRAVERCVGHILQYATYWTVEDRDGKVPMTVAVSSAVHDRAYCEREAIRLNRLHALYRQ